jgi:hypothetical protein
VRVHLPRERPLTDGAGNSVEAQNRARGRRSEGEGQIGRHVGPLSIVPDGEPRSRCSRTRARGLDGWPGWGGGRRPKRSAIFRANWQS